ncbi:MAG: hypothetical protein JXA30_19490 [Deltaproteobacteria bacterium]|nr:hypothetical protein [Deltaproteobacteria bacterium]
MSATALLPGGIIRNGQNHRIACFRPITGSVEMAIASSEREASSIPAWVSGVLAAAVEKVGELPMSPGLADEMSVGDRMFLMIQLGILLNGDDTWLTTSCEACEERFDLCIRRSAIAVRSASPTYPVTSVDLNGTAVLVRAPTGADQRWLCACQPPRPEQVLLKRCLTTEEGASLDDQFVMSLSESDRVALELAIEEMGPEVQCVFNVVCPECGYAGQIAFDPYWRNGTAVDLDEEIHALAFYYHWSEPEILAITRERKRRYLELVDQERGRYV